jgi:hypothetical protein
VACLVGVEVPVESCHFPGLAETGPVGLDHTGRPFCAEVQF